MDPISERETHELIEGAGIINPILWLPLIRPYIDRHFPEKIDAMDEHGPGVKITVARYVKTGRCQIFESPAGPITYYEFELVKLFDLDRGK